MKKRLTIGVPVYNSQNTIRRCLCSILAQRKLEQLGVEINIICIDDGSKDDSLKILKSFEGDNVIVIHTDNNGAFAARQKIIELADSEWIGFVDADDEIESDMYYKMLEGIDDDEIDNVVCALKREKSTKQYIEQMKTFGNATIDLRVTPEAFLSINPSFCNKLFKTEIAKKANDYLERTSIMEDAFFSLCVFPFIRKIKFISDSCYVYHFQNDSITKKIGLTELEMAEKAAYRLLDNYSEYEQVKKDVLVAMLVIHLGIAFTVNTCGNINEIKEIHTESLRYLNKTVPEWRRNAFYSLSYFNRPGMKKVIISGRLFETMMWPTIVYIYMKLSSSLGLDMKW